VDSPIRKAHASGWERCWSASTRQRSAGFRRQGRHRFHPGLGPGAAHAARCARAIRLPVHTAPCRSPGPRALGQAEAGRGGDLHRVDRRRQDSPSLVSGPARRQTRLGGHSRAPGSAVARVVSYVCSQQCRRCSRSSWSDDVHRHGGAGIEALIFTAEDAEVRRGTARRESQPSKSHQLNSEYRAALFLCVPLRPLR